MYAGAHPDDMVYLAQHSHKQTQQLRSVHSLSLLTVRYGLFHVPQRLPQAGRWWARGAVSIFCMPNGRTQATAIVCRFYDHILKIFTDNEILEPKHLHMLKKVALVSNVGALGPAGVCCVAGRHRIQ